MTLLLDSLSTPLGRFSVVVDDAGQLHASGFTEEDERMEAFLRAPAFEPTKAKNPGGVCAMIAAYFEGELTALDGLPVAFATGTQFQLSVWRALREVPCGQTWSYGQLAQKIGRPTAVRAVGLANGANPVGLVVPCHRVIGSDGSLTGYGGGLHRKRWLLAHERRASPQLSLI
jgi:methylated-DNA-[protein]-cysteine S-methyltransferase